LYEGKVRPKHPERGFIAEGRRKKEEGRRKKEEGRSSNSNGFSD